MAGSINLPTEQELVEKHLGAKPKAEKEPVATGSEALVQKMGYLLEEVEEIAGALMSLRNSLRDQTGGLQATADRAMKLISVFEHQINLFTNVNQEMMKVYRVEMKEIAQECVREVTKALAEQVRLEVADRLHLLNGEIVKAKSESEKFRDFAKSSAELIKVKTFYMLFSAFAGAGIATALLITIFKLF